MITNRRRAKPTVFQDGRYGTVPWPRIKAAPARHTARRGIVGAGAARWRGRHARDGRLPSPWLCPRALWRAVGAVRAIAVRFVAHDKPAGLGRLTAQRQDWSRLPARQAPGRGCCAPRLSTPGYVDDDDGLQQTAEQVDRPLDAGGLGDMDAAFLLEGSRAARPPAPARRLHNDRTGLDSGPQRSTAWRVLKPTLGAAHPNPTQSHLALGIPVTVEDERLGASGLAACAASGYTRQHHEISALLESTASYCNCQPASWEGSGLVGCRSAPLTGRCRDPGPHPRHVLPSRLSPPWAG